MTAADPGAIDWGHPVFTPLAAAGTPPADAVARDADPRDALNARPAAQAIRTCSGRAVHFVPQDALPAGAACEVNITAIGEVPTQDNLHGFFNALIWLH